MLKLFLLFLFVHLIYAEPILPLPQKYPNVNTKKANLGKALFSDTILSIDNTISCASCHILDDGGDDNLKFSFGVNAKQGNINSPTVYNAVYNFRQFWNGRAKNLQEQAKGPILNPVEMGNNFPNLIKTLQKSKYNNIFGKIYTDGVTEENIVDAITEFEKTLITPNSPFDRYLKGDKNALTKEQKQGYHLFKELGCVVCHQGINIGGNMYARLGVMRKTKIADRGRFNVTKKERDMYYFKVPSLRNVARTSPYFHDGRFNTLEEVIKFMVKYQLAKAINPDQIKSLISFLKSLSGTVPKD